MRLKKIYLLLVVIILLVDVSCSKAQQQITASNELTQRDRAAEEKLRRDVLIANLISDSKAQNAEIASDALIRLVESNLVTDRQQKIDLLEEAFRRASEAQHKVRIDYAGTADTRSGVLSDAFSMEMDELSLKCRVVKAFLLIDKNKARKLFSEISPRISLPPLGCKDGFVSYDVSIFYNTLNEILRNTFSEKEQRQNLHIQFLLPYINNITSPSQVLHIMKTFASIKTTNFQFLLLINNFLPALKNVSSDDHSFRRSMSSDAITKQFIELIKLCEKNNASKYEALQAIRLYLLTQLNGTRCSDGLKFNTQSPATTKYVLPGYIEFANKNLLVNRPITVDEINPSKVEEARESADYYESISAQDRLDRYRKLRFTKDNIPLSDSEKETPEWEADFSQLLNDIGAWLPDDDISEEDYFHQKCIFFQTMLEIIPEKNTELRQRVFRDLMSFLNSSQMQRSNSIEWLLRVQTFLNIFSSAQGQDKVRFKEILDDSNSTIQLYLRLRVLTKTQETVS
jgi:hypothetical protein